MAVERVDINEQGSPWHEEHLSRYVYATKYFSGKRVLDIACGTGFGSKYIAQQSPAFLYSADVSEEALSMTKSKLESETVNFEVGFQNGTKTTFPDNNFDTIISIETIEHIDDDLSFLKELNRILAPKGTLILSTPNGLITNPDQGIPSNKFHVREDFPDILKKKIEEFFVIEKAAGQHIPNSYGPAPFLPSFAKPLMSFNQRVLSLIWSMILRFPVGFRDVVYTILRGHKFYPTVSDYTFLEENLEKAHVQYYECKKKG